MARKVTPVWIYLPDNPVPVIAGLFSWDSVTRVGEFRYDPDYLAILHAISLDGDRLRLARSPIRETRQEGIFGVFRDAGPDAWGLDQLFRQFGDLDAFDVLLKGPADGVGNLAFGETPRTPKAYSLAELDDVSRGFPPDDAAIEHAIHPTTSMGGAKPKLLVEDDTAFWIAKFPEKGDPRRLLAINEHVMLEMAKSCGIDSAHSRLHTLPDGRAIVLVQRFDMARSNAGIVRKGFASAYTALGLGDAPARDAQNKSYLRLAEMLMRWSGKKENVQIWRRLAYNAMVGNIDDHPRNHAFVCESSSWQLSPAFDIVASARPAQVALSMRFHSGGAVASPHALLESAFLLGLDQEEAIHALKDMASTILATWRSRFETLGARPDDLEKLASAFKMADTVMSHPFVPIATKSRYRAAPSRPTPR